MKKIAFILSFGLLPNAHAVINNISEHDFYVGGSCLAAGLVVASIASCYLHPASLEKAKIEAAQEDKRTLEQKAREERQKQEQIEKERTRASIVFATLAQDYAPEVNALLDKGLSKERLTTIVKSKQAKYESRFKDYYETLTSNINLLHTVGVLLSPDEKKKQTILLTHLEETKHVFNLKLNEDINFEKDEARRVKRIEEAEQRKIEREQLEIKKIRGEVEAQKTIKDTYDLVKNISHDINSTKQEVIRVEKKSDLQLTAITRQLGLVVDTIKEAIAAGNAQFAQRISSIFAKEIEEAKKSVQTAMQNQSAPNVIANQVPPPYNPAATNLRAPSEAVDSGAMPMPLTPPPSYA